MFGNDEIQLAQNLLGRIIEKNPEESLVKTKELLEVIFGKRFSDGIEKNGILRYKSLAGQEDNIQYWGLLYEGATASGVYENFSLVAFPDNTENPTQILLCFGIGTGGITDDANLLGIPGVKRSINSLLNFIKKENWLVGGTRTFVKDEIMDEITSIPKEIINNLGNFSDYDALWKKYGKYLPSVCVITNNESGAKAFLSHILLYGHFREWSFKSNYSKIVEDKLIPELIEVWRKYPDLEKLELYLQKRKYIILQGPPGTGKTFLAEQIAKKFKDKDIIEDYETIQFHSSVTYEDFVEGIRPNTNSNQLVFKDYNGPFKRCIEKAEKSAKGYLLIIDEINRGDIAKILGEAIFLLEPGQERKITLRSGNKIKIPNNFYIIGTMNTADRSIAILDFAVRRRFAFIDIWPSVGELEKIYINKVQNLKEKALKYYNKVQNIFFYFANEEDLHLQPGHTYFIAESIEELNDKMKYEVAPLLKEYLAIGKLTLAKNELQAIIGEFEELQTQ